MGEKKDALQLIGLSRMMRYDDRLDDVTRRWWWWSICGRAPDCRKRSSGVWWSFSLLPERRMTIPVSPDFWGGGWGDMRLGSRIGDSAQG